MAKKTYNTYDEIGYLSGPYPLTEENAKRIRPGTLGVYVLAHPAARSQATLVVYVGRGDLRSRLRTHALHGEADHFAFKSLEHEEVAYLEECRLFHKYGKTKHLEALQESVWA